MSTGQNMSTGQAVLSVVGAVVGAAATGGSPYGAYIGAQISAEISGFNDPALGDQQRRAVPKHLREEADQA